MFVLPNPAPMTLPETKQRYHRLELLGELRHRKRVDDIINPMDENTHASSALCRTCAKSCLNLSLLFKTTSNTWFCLPGTHHSTSGARTYSYEIPNQRPTIAINFQHMLVSCYCPLFTWSSDTIVPCLESTRTIHRWKEIPHVQNAFFLIPGWSRYGLGRPMNIPVETDIGRVPCLTIEKHKDPAE